MSAYEIIDQSSEIETLVLALNALDHTEGLSKKVFMDIHGNCDIIGAMYLYSAKQVGIPLKDTVKYGIHAIRLNPAVAQSLISVCDMTYANASNIARREGVKNFVLRQIALHMTVPEQSLPLELAHAA